MNLPTFLSLIHQCKLVGKEENTFPDSTFLKKVFFCLPCFFCPNKLNSAVMITLRRRWWDWLMTTFWSWAKNFLLTFSGKSIYQFKSVSPQQDVRTCSYMMIWRFIWSLLIFSFNRSIYDSNLCEWKFSGKFASKEINERIIFVSYFGIKMNSFWVW